MGQLMAPNWSGPTIPDTAALPRVSRYFRPCGGVVVRIVPWQSLKPMMAHGDLTMRWNTPVTLFALALLTAPAASARIFCANDSADLQQILDMAAVNGEHDEVRIRRGDYVAPIGGFEYLSSENFDIEISGGWNGLGQGCNFNGASDPFDTRLTGVGNRRVLSINAGPNADIVVTAIQFDQGNASLGGGLLIFDSQNDPLLGDIDIALCAFTGNFSSSEGSALFASGGDVIRISNSLFANNGGSDVISISQTDRTGLYFTNNTVVDNVAGGSSAEVRLRLLGTSSVLLANNILWNNEVRDLSVVSPAIHLFNNNIGSLQGPDDPSTLSINPDLLSDFSLAPGSPMIDIGTRPPRFSPIPVPFENAWSLGDDDLLRVDRILGPQVDLGAFEAPVPRPDLMFSDGFE